MKPFRSYTLTEYTHILSQKVPAPGGGSAAALTAALGAALLSMVANYSIGKTDSKNSEKEIKASLKQSEQLRKRLLILVDLDAQAYLRVVKTRKGTPAQRKAALQRACEVPMEVCKLCYKGVQLTPNLVLHGNRHLLSDVYVALELLLAAFNAAKKNVEINQ